MGYRALQWKPNQYLCFLYYFYRGDRFLQYFNILVHYPSLTGWTGTGPYVGAYVLPVLVFFVSACWCPTQTALLPRLKWKIRQIPSSWSRCCYSQCPYSSRSHPGCTVAPLREPWQDWRLHKPARATTSPPRPQRPWLACAYGHVC